MNAAIIQWPPSLADVLAAGAFLGAAVLNALHSYQARQRMFERIDDLEKANIVLRVTSSQMDRDVRAIKDVLIARGLIRPTNPGFTLDE